MTEPLSFDLDRKEQTATIGGDDYVLRELDGKERDRYLNSLGNRMKTSPNGGQSLKNFDGLQASLITASLFKLEGGERVAVKEATVQAWPARVLTGLFNAAKELSALGDEEDEDDEEGNG